MKVSLFIHTVLIKPETYFSLYSDFRETEEEQDRLVHPVYQWVYIFLLLHFKAEN